jgi:hypothetical protein
MHGEERAESDPIGRRRGEGGEVRLLEAGEIVCRGAVDHVRRLSAGVHGNGDYAGRVIRDGGDESRIETEIARLR